MSDGLDDVVAAHTVLSEVDGAAGRLVIRGHSLAELAGTRDAARAIAILHQVVPEFEHRRDNHAPVSRSGKPAA